MTEPAPGSCNDAEPAAQPWRGGEPFLRAVTRPDDPEHHLPQMILFRLLKLTNLMVRPYFLQRADTYRMNLNEMRVLMTLAQMGSGASHELCEVAGLHPMNVSRAVAVLRRQGRIAEERDPANRRRKLLTLTEEGERVVAELTPDMQDAAARLVAGFDEAQCLTLSRLIDAMTANVEGNGERSA